jgi:hypothetical protein
MGLKQRVDRLEREPEGDLAALLWLLQGAEPLTSQVLALTEPEAAKVCRWVPFFMFAPAEEAAAFRVPVRDLPERPPEGPTLRDLAALVAGTRGRG